MDNQPCSFQELLRVYHQLEKRKESRTIIMFNVLNLGFVDGCNTKKTPL